MYIFLYTQNVALLHNFFIQEKSFLFFYDSTTVRNDTLFGTELQCGKFSMFKTFSTFTSLNIRYESFPQNALYILRIFIVAHFIEFSFPAVFGLVVLFILYYTHSRNLVWKIATLLSKRHPIRFFIQVVPTYF